MKNQYLIIGLMVVVVSVSTGLPCICVDSVKQQEKIEEKSDIDQIDQDEEYLEENDENLLTFRVKKRYLWVKNSSLAKGKSDDDFIEVALPGELYNHPKKILTINKKEADKSTLEGIVVSFFSAHKAGDLKWITSNFVSDEQKKIKTLFKNQTVLRDSQKDFQNIKTIYLTGEAGYKDYVILFVKEIYQTGKRVTEAITCKQFQDSWRITNALTNDETYDVVFAALSNGDIIGQPKN